eukprot:COSAG02_NODE_239_length_27693_cov_31.385700_6_plen_68_part_00
MHACHAALPATPAAYYVDIHVLVVRLIQESIDKRQKVSMLCRVARAGDGGAAARGDARAACGLESQA